MFKILTGDNEEVAKSVCKQVGIKFDKGLYRVRR